MRLAFASSLVFLIGALPWTVVQSLAQTSPASPGAGSKKAPPAVDRALRARASEFLQDHTEGSFAKAFELVAPDSKDYFLTLPKEKLGDVKVAGVEYNAKLNTAVVSSTVVRQVNMGPAGIRDIPSSRTDNWKLVGGKWMWYHDTTQDCGTTLLGPLPCAPSSKVDPTAAAALPKDTRPEAVASAAKDLLPGQSINKKSLLFTRDVPSVGEILYHNSVRGQVRVMVDFIGNQQGLTLEANEKWLNADEDFVIKLNYTPNPNSPQMARMRIMVEPFGSTYLIPVGMLTKQEMEQNGIRRQPEPARAVPSSPPPVEPAKP